MVLIGTYMVLNAQSLKSGRHTFTAHIKRKREYSLISLHSKHFQSSYSAKVRVGAKKMEGGGGGGGDKRKRLPANPTILENAP